MSKKTMHANEWIEARMGGIDPNTPGGRALHMALLGALLDYLFERTGIELPGEPPRPRVPVMTAEIEGPVRTACWKKSGPHERSPVHGDKVRIIGLHARWSGPLVVGEVLTKSDSVNISPADQECVPGFVVVRFSMAEKVKRGAKEGDLFFARAEFVEEERTAPCDGTPG